MFNELSKEIYIYCDEFIDIIDKKAEVVNEVANIMVVLRESFNEKEKEELGFEALIETLKNNIEELKYEKESIKIYEKKDKIINLQEDLHKKETMLKDSEIKKGVLKRHEDILECAKIHRDYQI